MTTQLSSRIECRNNQHSCEDCPAHGVCLVYASDPGQRYINSPNRVHFPVYQAGSHIYWNGEPLKDFYIVRSGCIKTYAVDEDGNDHIRGFHLPGDVLALDALKTGNYQSNACAVTDATVCPVHHRHMLNLEASHPDFCRQLMTRMSADLSEALVWAGEYSAEQRLAAFLLQLNQREIAQGMVTGGEIKLMISRRDIANYLRLAPETVSRNLTRFEKRGLLQCSVRNLRIVDRRGLAAIASPIIFPSTVQENQIAA